MYNNKVRTFILGCIICYHDGMLNEQGLCLDVRDGILEGKHEDFYMLQVNLQSLVP